MAREIENIIVETVKGINKLEAELKKVQDNRYITFIQKESESVLLEDQILRQMQVLAMLNWLQGGSLGFFFCSQE